MTALPALSSDVLSEWVAPDLSNLVTEDDTPLDSMLSEKNQRVLTEPLYSSWAGPPPGEGGAPRPFLALANVGLFPSPREPPVVPDVMLSLDVEAPADFGAKEHRSYFVWMFGKPPDVVIEIVSNREGDELGVRFQRYRRMRVAYYVVYDPLHQLGKATLSTFELRGDLYVPVERPRFESVGLGLVEWEGAFEGHVDRWLRWCTLDGTIVPTGAERAGRAEERAGRAEERARRLAERLRALGIDPDEDA
jgi:Putative restriction endonuclease